MTGRIVLWANSGYSGNDKYEPMRKIRAQSQDVSVASAREMCWGGYALVLSSTTEFGFVDVDAALSGAGGTLCYHPFSSNGWIR